MAREASVIRRRCVVVMGIMGQVPFAGVGWQVLHYLEGFRRLNHEVYYVEDTRDWPYDPERNAITDDCSYTVGYLSRVMAWCGLSDRWAYRAEPLGGRTFGLSDLELALLYRRADVIVNLHGAAALRDEHLRVPTRIYLETDPVKRQIEVARGEARAIELLAGHTHHFTFAENLGAADCRVPVGRFEYRPTRQPVLLDWWTQGDSSPNGRAQARAAFTTISNWRQSGRDIEWKGETYVWSKHAEFLKFIDLPRRTAQPLELAVAADDETIQLIRGHGWRTIDAVTLSKDIVSYRRYILGSRGEFTVAKDQYVRPRSGWFSDRSACYLAAGRPVITQDTGFSKILPTGRGLFAFETVEDILGALEAIEGDYAGHCRAALDLAMEYFAAERVLSDLLGAAGL